MISQADKKKIVNVGLRIRKLRLKTGLTQGQLAFECGIELSQISRIERGVINTSITTVYKIAEVLEISVKELF